jgi:hypothetical protein
MDAYLTAEQITKIAEDACDEPKRQRRVVYRMFRKQDDSHLWPINGRFNVTDRAIRRLQRFERDAGTLSTLEIAYFLEHEMSRIVNGND